MSGALIKLPLLLKGDSDRYFPNFFQKTLWLSCTVRIASLYKEKTA
nr:MAG TPA: hypothetical protein [Caudoviricetes sp.]DAN10824.1 MAG TPA: hypothetical protein [Caudoviricetes sp.]DAT02512.1 MAG TPA: hypothetical protein [Caudoviricetes sp.]